MKKVVFQITMLTCLLCIKKIEKELKRYPGVEEAKVLFHANKVRATFDHAKMTVEKLEEIIAKLGYPVLAKKVS